MQIWQPASPGTKKQRLALTLALVIMLPIATVAALTLAPQSAAASGLTLGALTVSDVNRTINGNVTDVRVNARLDYQHDVPDATRRIVKLQVGPSENDLETVTFIQEPDPQGKTSGTVELSGSLLDANAFSRMDFDPALADSKTTEVVVRATVEVRREGGSPVTKSVTKHVSVSLTDGTELTVDVGGSVEVVVVTDA